jgi:pyrroline-5-carboxylate reductase
MAHHRPHDGPLWLIGGGNLGGALLSGWIDCNAWPGRKVVIDPRPGEQVTLLSETYEVDVAAVPAEAPGHAPLIAVAAVKPDVLKPALEAARPCFSDGTAVISVAAGQRLATLAGAAGADRPLIRAMPNTPSAVGRGMTVCVGNGLVTEDLRAHVDALFGAVGRVAWVEDEALLDAVTAVSGSGPAYVFYLAECLAEAGRAAGLTPDLAEELAVATVGGAGEMLWRGTGPPGRLREAVTSPEGTTAAALDVLIADGGLATLLREAVLRAKARAEELGR